MDSYNNWKKIILFAFLIGLNLPLNGIDIYWIGGSGKWSDLSHWATTSGGSIRPSSIPGSKDNVIFDSKSFTSPNQLVQIDQQITFCQSLDMSKVTQKIEVSGASTSVLNIFGSLLLNNQIVFSFSGEVNFSAALANAQIQMAGNAFHRIVRFKENTGSFQLNGGIIIDSLLIFEGGTFSSKGFSITTDYLDLKLENAKTDINLDSSDILVRGDAFYLPYNSYIEIPSAVINYTTGKFSGVNTSISLSSINSLFQVKGIKGLRWGQLALISSLGKARVQADSINLFKYILTSETNTTGVISMDTLVLSKGRTYRFQEGKNYKLKSLIAKGDCSNPIQILSGSGGIKTNFIASAGILAGDYLSIRDVSATGGATFNANNSTDLGNNNGWIITPKVSNKLYWVGGSGDWYDPMHWSSTSGGTPGNCVPTAGDDVFFDANSFPASGGTVNLNIDNAYCRSMDWTGAKGNPIFSGTSDQLLHIFGYLKLINAMSWKIQGDVFFEGNTSGNSITMASQKFKKNLYFNGVGSWILEDDLEVDLDLYLVKGGLNTNSKFVFIQNFRSQRYDEVGNIRSLNLGSSIVTIRPKITPWSEWNMQTNNFTLNAGTSTIIFVSYGNINLWGSNQLLFNQVQHYGQITLSSSGLSDVKKHEFNYFISYNNLVIWNNVRFIKWEIYGGNQYKMYPGGALFVGELIPLNACEGLINLSSYSDDLKANIHFEKNVTVENFIVKDFHSVGPGVITANNSVNLGNNLNWIFNEKTSRKLFWVGGTGTWTDKSHWSLTSNGPGGECIPTPLDDVFFDAFSFPNPNGILTFEANSVYAKNFTIGDVKNKPWFRSANVENLELFGNLVLAPTNICNFSLHRLRFKGKQTSNTALFAGQYIPYIEIDGSGKWTTLDSLPGFELNFRNGTFNTNGNPVNINYFYGGWESTKKRLELGSSHWYINAGYENFNEFNVSGDSIIVVPGTSTIEFTNGGDFYERKPHTFHRLYFSSETGNSTVQTESGVSDFKILDFLSSGTLLGKHKIDSLLFAPGKTYRLDANNPQEITGFFQVFGNNCNPIELLSTQTGKQSQVIMNSGEIKGDFIQMRDQIGVGSVKFYAGVRSANIANSNTNWIFDSPNYYENEGFLGPDLVQCTLEPIVLDARTYSPGERYNWFNNSVQPKVSVNAPGTYWAKVTFGTTCVITDTVRVLAADKFEVNLPGDTTLCVGDTLRLDAKLEAIGVRYVWQDSSLNSFYVVTKPGKYKVSVTLSGCTVSDSIEVKFQTPLRLNLGKDTLLCPAATLTLDASLPGATAYTWQNNTTLSKFIADKSGLFFVAVKVGVCLIKDTISIDYQPVIDLQFGRDTTVCADVTLTLGSTTSYESYLWQDGSRNQTYQVRSPGIYSLTVVKNGCTKTGSVNINHKQVPTFSLPPLLSSCEGKTITIGQSPVFSTARYLWTNGLTTPEITVSTSAVYGLEIDLAGCIYKDEVQVTFNPLPVLNMPQETLACQGDTVTLNVAQANTTFFWSTGELTPSIKVSKSGLNWVQATNQFGCLNIDTTFVVLNQRPSVAAGPDLLLCAGEIGIIEVGFTPGSTLKWNNGESGAKISVLSNGIYVVEAKLNGCLKTDSVTVTFIDVPNQFLGTDKEICEGDQVRLEPMIPSASYIWQDGSTNPYFLADKTGTYSARVGVGTCQRIDSVRIVVNDLPRFELGKDSTLCSGGSYLIGMSVPVGSTYRWNTGATTPSLSVTQTGTYIATATFKGCIWKDTIIVSVIPRIPVYLGLDTTICEGQRILLRANVAAEKYQWQDGSDGQQFLVDDEGLYFLRVTSGKCVFTDSVNISVRKCIYYEVYAPNAFSPNDDGVNDVFKLFVDPDVSILSFKLIIHDRWGNLIFQSTDPALGWDGSQNGNRANPDTYIYAYTIEYEDENGAGRQVNGGTVNLLR
ncbi:MAG: gliding motility-associated C-terminal domain-containing protein [Saprospiraceae bacterium]